MTDLERCTRCGQVTDGTGDMCAGCGTVRSSAPPATTSTSSAPPARPDPYSQISNPLHTGWDPTAPRVATTDDVNFTVESRRVRSRWWRRLAVALVLVALGAGAWLARDEIGSAYDDLSERISGDEALGSAPAGS